MPARAIPNGQTVTLRLDADLVFQLKMTARQSGIGLSELCGPILAAALETGSLPSTPKVPTKLSKLSKLSKPSKAAKGQSEPTTTKKRMPGAPYGKRGIGDKELFHQLQQLIKQGTITQADLARAAGVTSANIRASWVKTEWVPAKYVRAVVKFLESKGIPPVTR